MKAVHSSLFLAFPTIRNLKITRSVLWILGEYCDTKENILEFMTELRKSIGEVSFPKPPTRFVINTNVNLGSNRCLRNEKGCWRRGKC